MTYDNQIIDNRSLALAQAATHQALVVSNTFTRMADDKFTGRHGDVVNMRVRSPLHVREYALYNDRAQPIKADHVSETVVQLKVDTNRMYQATSLRQEVFDFDLEGSWGELLVDQGKAMAEAFELRAGQLVQNAPYEYVKYVDITPTKIKEQIALGRDLIANEIVDAKNALARMGSPLTGTSIYAVAGSNWATELRKNQKLALHTGTGDEDAFSQMTIGTYAGVTIVEDLTINPDELYLYTKDAFLQWSAAPGIMPGLVNAYQTTVGNLAMTHILDYDPGYLQGRSILNSYTAFNYAQDFAGVRDTENQLHISEETYFIRGAKLILGKGTDVTPGSGTGTGKGAEADSYLAKLFKNERIEATSTTVFLDQTYQNVATGKVKENAVAELGIEDGIRSVPARGRKKATDDSAPQGG
ncbi:hypothetical protein E4U03_04665 [Rothia nasimurium]|uniref:Major capsid protein n=1 Tax=Rothia nasimurium TaxID=85336 RepID=A0A4Y9F622_9MICC|nr:hypothetical protein [Rothia nasimurium]MBF0807910.1 hypothetical protein [Rothia nasimurium]TFU22912.1 hypothetical protein E4U03_04665 [Rothia nasimurium]